MQCKICGNNLVRGFTFCLECGTPVPAEMLEESGLPDRNIDRGPQEITPPNVSKPAGDPQAEEQVGDLQPKLVGGEQDRGEALKPQLVGGDTYEQGKALKPKLMGLGEEEAGEALKPRLIGGEEQAGGGQKVRATLQNSSSDTSDTAVEKLVFCPNCGMHMQHDQNKCEICGMALENKQPNYVPKTESGIPLFNTDPDPFSGTSGFGSFTGGFGSISGGDIANTGNFANGNTDPMFNSGSSAFNVQATPADFAHLTEQIASFSSSAVPDIGVTENTRVRQKAAPKGKDVELSDFSMSDDLQSESIPISDRHVPVVGDYSMEENPDEDINIDPFAFVSMSMDEEPKMPVSKSQMPGAEPPEAVPDEQPPVVENIRPVPPVSAPEEYIPEETTPYIAEESPVIGESTMPEPITESALYQSAPTEAPKPPAAEPVTAPPQPSAVQPQERQQTQAYQQAQPYQQPQEYLEPQPYQQPQEYRQPQPEQQAQPYQQPQPYREPDRQAQPNEAAPSPAPKTKKCFACGITMPAKDKFCPNCGRSMFGVPNPHLERPQPTPPPAKKKPVAVIVIIAVILVAVVVLIFLMQKGNAAEIDLGELAQTVSNAGQAEQYTVSHIVS